MAELQFPNIVGGFLAGRQLGQQETDRRQAQATRSRIGELASLAYGAAPDQRQAILGEAVGIDPEAGLALSKALGSEDDAREQRLLSTARLIDAAPPEQKAAIFQNVRPQIAQYLPNLPEAYDDDVGQGIKAFIASRGGQSDVKVVGNSLVDSAGNVIYQAPQRYLTNQGLIEVGPQGAREITVGAPPAQVGPIGDVAAGTPFTIDPSIPPEVAAQIRQQELVQGGVQSTPAPITAGGRRILPPSSAAEAERLALAREANARAAAAAQRADEAAALARQQARDREEFGVIPPGWRIKADRSGIEPVPGGPKPAGATASESERKAATLLNRLEFSLGQLNQAVREDPDAASPSVAASLAGSIPFVGDQARNIVNPQERQRVEAAQLDILDAALTLGTGAAYTREQLEGYRRSYFPQIGDSDATVKDKQARLENVISAARIAAGRAAPQAEAAPAQPPAPRQAPQPAPVQRARNPQTGQVIELRNGQWVPVNG